MRIGGRRPPPIRNPDRPPGRRPCWRGDEWFVRTDSIVKHPSFAARIPKGRACAPVLFERRRVRRNLSRLAPGTSFAPGHCRGDGAPSGATISPTPGGVGALCEARSPLGAPSRLFCPRGRNFRARTGPEPGPRSGQLSPPFVRAASSPCGQSLLVGTDGGPGPPGSGVTSPARRRRTWLRRRNVSRRRPQPSQTIGL